MIQIRRTLVTGGAGFIGSELINQLLEYSEIIIVVDNLVNGRRENLAGLPKDRVFLIVDDIRNSTAMTELLVGIDIVFHLACLGVRHSIHSPLDNHNVNATATLNLLKLSRDGGVGRFVYVSSSEVYGSARWTPMTEEHPCFPMTIYGASKLAGESYTRAYYRTYKYPTVVVRPFNSYGPHSHHEGDSGEVIPKFMLRCMSGQPMIIFGDGNQTRDFTYVSDTARGILLAGLSDAAIGETINLGSGGETTINQLTREIATVLGNLNAPIIYDEPRPGDVHRLLVDTTKAKNLLDFKPKVGLKEGLQMLRDWYLSLEQSPEDLLENEIVHNWLPREENRSG